MEEKEIKSPQKDLLWLSEVPGLRIQTQNQMGGLIRSNIGPTYIIPINRMLKKNISERRFNTAAARIMLSSKLPSDFFAHSRQKEGRQSSLWSNRHENVEKHLPETAKKDPLLFTFHRSSSEDRLKMRRGPFDSEGPGSKLFAKMVRKSQPKLPPVSVQVPRQLQKENINASWFKDFGSNKDKLKKLGRISNRFINDAMMVPIPETVNMSIK